MADRQGGDRFEAIKRADELSELSAMFGTESIHEIYFSAKNVWERVVRQAQDGTQEGLPGSRAVVDGQVFHVHGVTHAGTDAEKRFLREHVREFLEGGGAVYCEQGIRPMYFEDLPAACEMDDYLWAMHRCEELPTDARIEAVFEDIAAVATELREATFSLIEAGSAVYGEQFERALGDIAAGFLTDHTDLAVGESYEAFQLRADASREPSLLADLQRYYERTFLPQPLEREWLRRHDPELEIMSHARNERMADYAVYHGQQDEPVHLIVGAAHQPGVVYYLEQYSEGRELPGEFELF